MQHDPIHLLPLRAQKGSFLGPAAKEGIAILFTDTSPRGAGIEGEDDDWDFGTGMAHSREANVYLQHNFLCRGWLLLERHGSKVRSPLQHEHAHSTRDPSNFGKRRVAHRERWHPPRPICAELAAQDLTRMSLFGHSMGGHGALCTYLASKTKQYRSASAFAPVSNPTKSPWGQKVFKGYLQGGIEEAKELYDATELISKHTDPVHILIDYVRRICSCLLGG